MKLLIISVGSLVGHDILDVINYPDASRRSYVEIVGINSLPDSPSNFRCDRCYLVPESTTPDFPGALEKILIDEAPDLILCGRDEDTFAVSQFKATRPDLPGVLPCSNPKAALIALDKRATAKFAEQYGLPFAESMVPEGTVTQRTQSLLEFCKRVGFPVIAKPIRGFASHGVYFLRSEADIGAIANCDGLIFQEYLGEAEPLNEYFKQLAGLPPLFVQAPSPGHFSCQAIVDPKGSVSSSLVMYNNHSFGRTVSNSRVVDSSLNEVMFAYVEKLIVEGARGPLNIQCRRDRNGAWKVQEINLRTNGCTMSRFLLGMDELYFIVRDFVPHAVFPEIRPLKRHVPNEIVKRYLSFPIVDADVECLTTDGVWSRQ